MIDDKVVLETASWPSRETRLKLLRSLEDRYGDWGSRLFSDVLGDETAKQKPHTPVRYVMVEPLIPELEPMPFPMTPRPPKPESEPGSEPKSTSPETEPQPRQWLVQRLSRKGFVDQDGNSHVLGDSLFGNTRLVNTWPGGVVLQRGRETVFIPRGATIVEK